MNGVGGYAGWRWYVLIFFCLYHMLNSNRIFILEGLVTILVSFCSFFVIVPFPEKSTMFSPEEKRILLARLEADGANVKHDKLNLWTHMKDWKIWLA